jgi:hypothetical protein
MCIHLPQKKKVYPHHCSMLPTGTPVAMGQCLQIPPAWSSSSLVWIFFLRVAHLCIKESRALLRIWLSPQGDRAQSCKAQRSPNQFAATSDWVRGDNEINVLAAQITCHQASRCTWSGAHPHPNSSSVVFLTKWSAFVQEFEEVGEKRYQFFFCLSSRCLQLHETDIRQKPLTLQNRGTTVPKLLAHIKIRSK